MTRILFIVSAVLLLAGAAHAQKGGQSTPLRIGFVDSQKIFDGLPEVKEAQKSLDKRLQVWRDSLEAMSKDFQSQYEAYDAQKGMMSEAIKEQKQQDLMRMQQAIQEYRVKKFGQEGEAAQLSEEVLSPIRKKILGVIDELAKEEGLNFVFDKATQAVNNLLYAEAKFDYTFKVLDKLNRGGK